MTTHGERQQIHVTRKNLVERAHQTIPRGVQLPMAYTGYASTLEAWRQNFLCEHPMGQASKVETDFSEMFHCLFNEVKAYQEGMEGEKEEFC